VITQENQTLQVLKTQELRKKIFQTKEKTLLLQTNTNLLQKLLLQIQEMTQLTNHKIK
jgi:hypothetical protein